MKIVFKSKISANLSVIKNGFAESLFVYLAPSFIPFKLRRFDGCNLNDEVHIELGLKLYGLDLTQNWISLITHTYPDEKSSHLLSGINLEKWLFVDEGKILPWPLKRWKHVHLVERIDDHNSLITDDISFDCGFLLFNIFMYPFLWMIFAGRPRKYKKFFRELGVTK